MRILRKLAAVLAAVLLLAVTASAALTAEDASAEAGKTAMLTFSFDEIYSVDGMFSLDDPEKITTGYTVGLADAGTTSVTVVGDHLVVKPGTKPVSADAKVTVKVTLSEDAPVGKGCTVFFNGTYNDAHDAVGNNKELHHGVRLTVKEAEQEAPPVPVVTPIPVDYSELERQIGIANGVDTTEYTEKSATALLAALETAKSARKSDSQDAVTIAAKGLKNAMAALEKMDYSKLRQAMADANAALAAEELGALWQELDAALAAGDGLLTSKDQAAVDAAEDEIRRLLGEIEAVLEELNTPEVVEVEVPVEVLPEDDYCNIAKHRIWPVAFFTSVAVNVALAVALITVLVRKKKYQNDDTPLVDYDIDYDMGDDL